MAWVLYLTNGYQVLYQVNRRGATPLWEGEGDPPADRPGTWSMSRLAVLVDLMEEEFRLEELPHLSGADRRALLLRKQRQLFREESYVSVTYLGRAKGGRKDDQFLFCTIRDGGSFHAWLKILAVWGITVTGIWSLPRLTASWKACPFDSGMRVMFYHCGNKIVLRQNYHQRGRLLFSRLSLLAEEFAEMEGAQELERTWRYLVRLMRLDGNQTVNLEVWVPDGLKAEAGGFMDEGLPNFQPHPVNLAEIASRAGWRESTADPDLPGIGAFLLGRRTFLLSSHYRDRTHSALERRRWLKLGLYSGAVVLMAVSAGYDTFFEQQSIQLNQEIQSLQEQHVVLKKKLARIEPPPLVEGLDPWQLKQALMAKDFLESHLLKPKPLLELVSSALDAYPSLRLDSLEWKRAIDAEEGEEDYAEDSDEEATLSLEKPVILKLTIVTPTSGSSLRKVLSKVENFTNYLGGKEGVNSVRLAGSSLPIKENETISGVIDSLEKSTRSATFTIEISFGGDSMSAEDSQFSL